MTDELGKASKHPVIHKKCEVKVFHGTGPYVLPGTSGGQYGRIDYTNGEAQWLPLWHGKLAPLKWDVYGASAQPYLSYTSLTPTQETTLKEDVLEKARQLKADVLLDLVEGNQIWPSVTSLAKSLPAMKDNWKAIRALVKSAPGSYLAYKFGISPLLSDFMAIDRHLPKLKADLVKHESGNVLRFSRFAEVPCTYSYSGGSSGIINGYSYFQQRSVGTLIAPPTVRYVLLVKPTVQYSSEIFKKLDYALSRFATSPASLAWEKVPFSFVADWFVDLRGALRGIDKMLGFEPYQIVGFSRSFSYKTNMSCFGKFLNTCNGNVLVDTLMGDVMCSYYDRSLVSDGATAPVWKPRFGKNQAGISAALIAQQLQKL